MILDATCGFKSTWFEKNIHDGVVYIDHRVMKPLKLPNGRNWEILPDIKAKWQALPFRDNVFSCIYFDPPQIFAKRKKKETMVMKITYDVLDPWTWRETIRKAFFEFMRVLKPDGVIVLKWNETGKSLDEFLDCCPLKPMFGTPTNHNSRHLTFFVVFKNQKIVSGEERNE